MVKIKRTFAVLAAVLLIAMSFFSFSSIAWGSTQHMYDYAGLMSNSELRYVNDYLTSLSEQLQFDIVGALIYDGLDADELRDAADDFYDKKGFGYGSEHDGCIFVVDMNSRQMTLVTTGYGITAVTDYGEEIFYDYVTDSLRDQDYVTAFTEKYADTMTDYVVMAREGTPVDNNAPGHDGYDWYQEPENNNGLNIPDGTAAAGMGGISVAVGAGVGLASSQRQKSKLKTVRRSTQANSYARRDSLVLTRKQDRFLYSNVAVTHRPKNDNRKQGRFGGGGTTIHMGSSGIPHGGGHGRGF